METANPAEMLDGERRVARAKIFVRARVLWRFPPTDPAAIRRSGRGVDRAGKDAMVAHVPGFRLGTTAERAAHLEALGYEVRARSDGDWRPLDLGVGGAVRWIRADLTASAFDGFVGEEAVELKPSTEDGVGALTPNEELLLRAGHVRLLFVALQRGLIGEPVGLEGFLAVPRRLDGVPVGEVRVEWPA